GVGAGPWRPRAAPPTGRAVGAARRPAGARRRGVDAPLRRPHAARVRSLHPDARPGALGAPCDRHVDLLGGGGLDVVAIPGGDDPSPQPPPRSGEGETERTLRGAPRVPATGRHYGLPPLVASGGGWGGGVERPTGRCRMKAAALAPERVT